MSKASGLAIAGLGLLLTACQVVGPDYQVPDDAAIHRKDLQGELAVEGKPVVSIPVPADWWRLYQDPRLDQLVQQAMASNTDLRWRQPTCPGPAPRSTRLRPPVAGVAG